IKMVDLKPDDRYSKYISPVGVSTNNSFFVSNRLYLYKGFNMLKQIFDSSRFFSCVLDRWFLCLLCKILLSSHSLISSLLMPEALFLARFVISGSELIDAIFLKFIPLFVFK